MINDGGHGANSGREYDKRGGGWEKRAAAEKAAAIARCMDVVPAMGNRNEMTQYCGSEGWKNILKCNSWRCS